MMRKQEREEVPMTIIGGFDVHRAQITFDYLDTETGEVTRGQIQPATRARLREWLTRFGGRQDVRFALEGCTGWRFVVEELRRVGVEAHLADPAEAAAKRGKKKRAKTDKSDAHHLRELLRKEDLPESWIPPEQVLEVRTLGRLYIDLMEERRAWQQRIAAQLYHQGAPAAGSLFTNDGRQRLAQAPLSPAGRQAVTTALQAIDNLSLQIEPLRQQLCDLGRRLPGARALRARYGIGPLTAPIIWAELGDCRRFRNSGQAVRCAGIDVTIWSSDGKRPPGRLSHQGSPELRWALYEAATCSSHKTSPDYAYYSHVRDRLTATQATLSQARRIARWCYHTLRSLGDQALAPPDPVPSPQTATKAA
jgi:transposase